MCLLWILLQLVVVFMYWDLPYLERRKTKDSVIHKEEENTHASVEDEEEGDEEVKPLMTSQELVGSYGSVVAPDPCRKHSRVSSIHNSPISSPVTSQSHEHVTSLKSSSLYRGKWLTTGWKC